MQLELEFIKGDKTEVKTFTILHVKSRLLRKAIELLEKIDRTALRLNDLDDLVDYVCEVYNNQFTRDQFYDGIDADLLVETVNGTINEIVEGATGRLNTFPSK